MRAFAIASLALALTALGCEDTTTPEGVNWAAFDAARPPIVPSALAVHDGDLLVAGEGRQPNLQDVLVWVSPEWQAIGNTLPVGSPRAIAVFRDRVVAGGDAMRSGGRGEGTHIAEREDPLWSVLGGDVDGRVDVLLVSGTRLWVGGAFTRAGGDSLPNLALWDGGLWRRPGGGVDGPVCALVDHDGHIVAGGAFANAGGAPSNGVAAWSGSAWTDLAFPFDGEVISLGVFDDLLVVGGTFTPPEGARGGPFSVARLVNDAWSPLGDLALEGGARALVVFEDELYAAGRGGAHLFDGESWRPVFSTSGEVRDLIVFRGTLIVATTENALGGTVARARIR